MTPSLKGTMLKRHLLSLWKSIIKLFKLKDQFKKKDVSEGSQKIILIGGFLLSRLSSLTSK